MLRILQMGVGVSHQAESKRNSTPPGAISVFMGFGLQSLVLQLLIACSSIAVISSAVMT
jgi:hypothetical protein